MAGTIARLWGLSGAERALLPAALLEIARARLLLATRPFASIQRMLDRRSKRLMKSARLDPRSIGRIVGAAARRVPGTTCLAQGIAAHALLLRNGFDARLVLGAAIGSEGFEAHAWVESDGEIVIGDPGDRSYAVFGPADEPRSK